MTEIDKSLEIMNRAQRAQMLSSTLTEYVADREEEVLAWLVHAYNADTLTNDQMRAKIGEIAGLRALVSSMDSDIRRGLAETERTIGYGEETDEAI